MSKIILSIIALPRRRIYEVKHFSTSHRVMAESFPPPSLKAAAERVAKLLKERNESICVAETAAGGLISAALLSTPGASRIYKGGVTVRFAPAWGIVR